MVYLNLFRYFGTIVVQQKIWKIMQKKVTLIISRCITYLSFQLLRNHRSFNIKIIQSCKIRAFNGLSNETSKYFMCFLPNILLRSDRFTKQSFVHMFLFFIYYV